MASRSSEPTAKGSLSTAQGTEQFAHAIDQIEKDLPRTYPDDPVVQERIEEIRDVLVRHMTEDPALSYCQGMNYVAAVFVLATSELENSFSRFCRFMTRIRGLWLDGFPLLEAGTAHFLVLAGTRSWFQHLQAQDIDPSLYLPQAWMAMFYSWLPLSTLTQYLAHLEMTGFAGMMAVTLSVLDYIGDKLTHLSGEEAILPMLKDIRELAPPVQVLLARSTAWMPMIRQSMSRPVRCTKPIHQPIQRQQSKVVDASGQGALHSMKDVITGAKMRRSLKVKSGAMLLRLALAIGSSPSKKDAKGEAPSEEPTSIKRSWSLESDGIKHGRTFYYTGDYGESPSEGTRSWVCKSNTI